MRGSMLALFGSILLTVVSFDFVETPKGDGFFENSYDGVWSGYVTATVGGVDVRLPLVVNLNAVGASGRGFVLLLAYEDGSFSDFNALTLTNVKIKGKKLSFSFDVNEPEIGNAGYEALIFNVSLKRKKAGFLAGKYTSQDPVNSRGKVVLFPADAERPLQGVWYGTTGSGAGRTVHYLQLAQSSPVSGYVYSGAPFGSLRNGDFSGTLLSGSATAGGSTIDVRFNYSAAKKRLGGTFTVDGLSTNVTLFPAGTRGKKVKISSVSPAQVPAGAMTTLTIRGKNFAAGVVVHFENANIGIAGITYVSSREVRCIVDVPVGIAEGTRFGVRVVNPDGRQAEKANVLTVSGDGDDSETTVSFASDIQPVFNDNCVRCHGAGGNAGLDLREGAAYNNIVNVPSTQMSNLDRIEPGDPDNSYLLRKIRGVGISGSRMPFGGPFLSSSTIAEFETWVREGARNN